MQIGLPQTPQHRPRRCEPRQDDGEKFSRGAILSGDTGAFDLVQRGQRQAAPGQGIVDPGSLERLHSARFAEAFGRGEITT
jgi:hypothetical protein